MIYNTEIAVVGASPAGLMAARNASLGGASVTLFEKKSKIGTPSHPANSIYEGMMNITGEKINKSYVRHKIKGMKLISPGGYQICIDTPGYAIHKKKFDRYYARQVEKTGGSIECNSEIVHIRRKGKKIYMVKKDENNNLDHVVCDILILADGIFSKNAQKLGLKTMTYPRDIAWGTELEIEAEDIGTTEYAEYYVGSHAPGWKSSYLPLGKNKAAVGVYVRRHGMQLDPYMSAWIKSFQKIKNISEGEMRITSRKFAGDPIVTLPNKITAANLMVCGGAAGQSGIGYAMRSGQIAGDVAAKSIARKDTTQKALSEYKNKWKSELWTEHIFGRIGLEAIRKMDDKEIDEIFEIFENENLTEKIRGNTLKQGLSVLSVMMRKNPKTLLKAGVLFRNI